MTQAKDAVPIVVNLTSSQAAVLARASVVVTALDAKRGVDMRNLVMATGVATAPTGDRVVATAAAPGMNDDQGRIPRQ